MMMLYAFRFRFREASLYGFSFFAVMAAISRAIGRRFDLRHLLY